jgi:glutaminase
MVFIHVRGDASEKPGPGKFKAEKPASDKNAETYYICGTLNAMKKGMAAYSALPLTAEDAATLRKLDAKLKDGGQDVRVARQAFFQKRQNETKIFMATMGRYERSTFIPAAEAEKLIRATGVL